MAACATCSVADPNSKPSKEIDDASYFGFDDGFGYEPFDTGPRERGGRDRTGFGKLFRRLVGRGCRGGRTLGDGGGEDFTIFEGSGSDIGWAVYRDHHLVPEFAAEHVTFHVYDWSGYSVQVDQEMAFATFDIRMEYEVRGEARERDAHGTAILVRTGDGWKLAHLHTS